MRRGWCSWLGLLVFLSPLPFPLLHTHTLFIHEHDFNVLDGSKSSVAQAYRVDANRWRLSVLLASGVGGASNRRVSFDCIEPLHRRWQHEGLQRVRAAGKQRFGVLGCWRDFRTIAGGSSSVRDSSVLLSSGLAGTVSLSSGARTVDGATSDTSPCGAADSLSLSGGVASSESCPTDRGDAAWIGTARGCCVSQIVAAVEFFRAFAVLQLCNLDCRDHRQRLHRECWLLHLQQRVIGDGGHCLERPRSRRDDIAALAGLARSTSCWQPLAGSRAQGVARGLHTPRLRGAHRSLQDQAAVHCTVFSPCHPIRMRPSCRLRPEGSSALPLAMCTLLCLWPFSTLHVMCRGDESTGRSSTTGWASRRLTHRPSRAAPNGHHPPRKPNAARDKR